EACETLAGYLPQWLAAGAKLIGGCCRTTMFQRLKRNVTKASLVLKMIRLVFKFKP
ncbi:homocysteine S-methyltransferase family protein, partial [Klebsiella pneumoniae]|nr:homocysteine S-methyltransferase family protein [Klebsiella pneumoniae]